MANGKTKRIPMVVFGSGESANKCLLGYKEDSSATRIVHICEMENPDGTIKAGMGDVPVEQLSGEYFQMRFCKRESLQSFISFLQKMDKAWEGEEK